MLLMWYDDMMIDNDDDDLRDRDSLLWLISIDEIYELLSVADQLMIL